MRRNAFFFLLINTSWIFKFKRSSQFIWLKFKQRLKLISATARDDSIGLLDLRCKESIDFSSRRLSGWCSRFLVSVTLYIDIMIRWRSCLSSFCFTCILNSRSCCVRIKTKNVSKSGLTKILAIDPHSDAFHFVLIKFQQNKYRMKWNETVLRSLCTVSKQNTVVYIATFVICFIT